MPGEILQISLHPRGELLDSQAPPLSFSAWARGFSPALWVTLPKTHHTFAGMWANSPLLHIPQNKPGPGEVKCPRSKRWRRLTETEVCLSVHGRLSGNRQQAQGWVAWDSHQAAASLTASPPAGPHSHSGCCLFMDSVSRTCRLQPQAPGVRRSEHLPCLTPLSCMRNRSLPRCF